MRGFGVRYSASNPAALERRLEGGLMDEYQQAIEHGQQDGHEIIAIAGGNVMCCIGCPFVAYVGR